MLERAWMTIMHGNGKLWGIQAWSRFSIFNMCYRALFTRSVRMTISAWPNQLYSYNLLFARDVMTISNIPLDATKFSVYQILFHYDYRWFYARALVSRPPHPLYMYIEKGSECWQIKSNRLTPDLPSLNLWKPTCLHLTLTFVWPINSYGYD